MILQKEAKNKNNYLKLFFSNSDQSSFAEAQRLKVISKLKRREYKIVEVWTNKCNSMVKF